MPPMYFSSSRPLAAFRKADNLLSNVYLFFLTTIFTLILENYIFVYVLMFT